MSSSLLSLALLLFSLTHANEQAQKKPHVLLLLVDDLGWTDISAHNAEYETKTIDGLISTGIELSNYYVHLVCSPTRSALMTGQFSFKLGLQCINTIGPGTAEHLPLDAPTIPELLKKVGYQTHMLGKWHLGYASWKYTPTGRGFDTHFGYFQGAEDYYTRILANGYDFWRNQQIERNYTGDYSTMLYDNYMTQLLHDYHDSKSSDPLFIYMAFQTVHTPIEVTPKNYTQCEHIESPNRQIYCNKIQYLDEVIQHYVDLFKQYKLWDDTLLVLSTDNGGMPYWSDDENPLIVSYGCNMPYRAGKATLFEGGVKGVGFINGGDNVIPSKMRGTKSDILSHTVDWLPTIVNGAVGQKLPSNVDFDGMDMWKALIDPKEEDIWQRNTLFIDVEKNGSFAGLIDGDYKYFQGEQLYTGYFPCGKTDIPRREKVSEWLFNLKDDPQESKNLVRDHPDLVRKYKKMIEDYVASGAYVQEQDRTSHPRAYPQYHDGVWEPWMD